MPSLRRLTHRDDDITVTPLLRAYLDAFDRHLRAIAAADHAQAQATRLLMTVLLAGSRP